MQKNYGRCHICRKEKTLTYEHVPPKCAFNNQPLKIVTGNIINETFSLNRKPWDLQGLNYVQQQKGGGYYSLCKECNTNTGSWYGNYYGDFAKSVHNIMCELSPHSNDKLELKSNEFYPLQVFKQIMSMFCSINNDVFADEQLSEFLLNKESNNFNNNKYQLYMYLSKGNLQKKLPFSILGHINKGMLKVSEITAYPFGFILYIDSNNEEYGTNITNFAYQLYNEKHFLEMILPVYECNIAFPLNYKTQEEMEYGLQNDIDE